MAKINSLLSLSKTHPELSKEAYGWNPEDISAGSKKRLSWQCPLGHIWSCPVQHRTGKQLRKCPYCIGRKVLTGFNDIGTTDPELVTQADGWDPLVVYSGSGMKLPWICPLGHRWTASVKDRTRIRKNRKTGCPVCSWSTLLTGFNDLETIDPDTALQANGWDPTQVIANSGEKRTWICSEGHEWEAVVRIRQREKTGCPVCSSFIIKPGFNDLKTLRPDIAKEAHDWDPTKIGVGSNKKLEWKCEFGHTWKAIVHSRTRHKNGCPACGRKILLKGFNDLQTLSPEIAKEANGWNPSQVIYGSAKKLEWKCSKGHIWEASCRNRVHGNTGCPFCSNNLIKSGVNDLKTTHPKLAEEADGWDPSKVSAGSDNTLPWKCLKDERHRWTAKVYSRKQGKNCPFCSNQKTLVGVNDLATTNPELASEAFNWDPTMYTSGSERNVSWKCRKFSNHIWNATIKSRKNSNCPFCSHNALLTGFNDFATRYPELAKQAYGWDPSKMISARNTKLEWQCSLNASHIWKTTITSRIAGSSCPTCNPLGGFNPMKAGYIYLLRHEYWSMLQIGITNDPEARLKSHSRLGWDALEVRGPMDGYLTREWETSILRMLKKVGASLGNENSLDRFDGYTEAWLEQSFPVSSIREVMDFVEDLEEQDAQLE